MENMNSWIAEKKATAATQYGRLNVAQRISMQLVLGTALIMAPELAFAGNGAQLFCYIANYFKEIVGGAALVVIMLWAIEHLFGVSKLHDVVIKVGVAAAIVTGAAAFITNSGLSASCG